MPAREIQITIGQISFNTSLTAVPMYLLTSTEDILGALQTRRTDTPRQAEHGSDDSPSHFEPRELLFRGEIHAASQSQRVNMQQVLDEAISLSRSQSFAGDDGYRLVEIVDEDGVAKQLYAKIAQMPRYSLIDEGMPESRRFEFVMFSADEAVYGQDLEEVDALEAFDSTTFTFQDGDLPTFQDGDLPTIQDVVRNGMAVVNDGTYASPPLIVIQGPALNPVVRNDTTSKKIEFSRNGGLTLEDGDTLTINVAAYTAVKTSSGVQTNVRSKISLDSDWFDIVPGANQIVLFDESVGELGAEMTISFRPAWV